MRAAIAAAALLAMTGTARAYHNADFATAVSRGGGNGIYFTGSPRAKRMDCTACHALSAGAIGVELASEPAELVDEHTWTPGRTYLITVTMTGEHLGDPDASTSGLDNNGWVAELIDDGGRLAGAWTSDDPERVFTMDVAGGDPRVVGGYDGDGRTRWVVELTAPDAGAGRLTLHLGAVDGNAAGGGVAAVVDPFGDDVFVGAWRFCESGTACDTSLPEVTESAIDQAHDSAARGCSAAGSSAGALLVLLVLLALRARAALVLLVLAGCLDQGDDPVFAECPNDICEYSSEGEPFGTDPDLDPRFFECEVQPVLQTRCANFACHGDQARAYVVYAPARLRIDGSNNIAEGFQPTTALELAGNLDGARAFSDGARPDQSLLLLKPLDTGAGGYQHFGRGYQGDVFAGAGDAGYQKILEWINGATATADCAPTTEVGP